MAYLLDTGILLRIADSADQWHHVVNLAVGRLGDAGEALAITTQMLPNFATSLRVQSKTMGSA